jgi:putative ABC transport system permease protein
MRFRDLIELALSNLKRTKLRTFLTTLGVIIGIGALVAMVSFGTGMQKNVSRMFTENDLFTSIIVTPQKIDVDAAMSGDVSSAVGALAGPAPVLNDSVLQVFRKLDGVQQAYPQIRFPVKVRFRGQETETSLNAIPVEMGAYAPYNDIPYGRFFQSDSDTAALLTPELLNRLNFRLKEYADKKSISLEDSARGVRTVSADSLIGEEIEIVSTVIDFQSMMGNPFGFFAGGNRTPTKDHITQLKIGGILNKTSDPFAEGRMAGDLFIPTKTAAAIPRLDFNNIWDLLKSHRDGGYATVYVRVADIDAVKPVEVAIENMGFGAFAILDQLEEIKKGFLLFDTALGAIGTIALIVAALGIINTMVMSILERTREIGVMKSIGGSEDEIRTIFFVEAGVIGFLGGVFGVALGWLATRVANAVANFYFAQHGMPHVEFFYIPLWLIAGAMAFSIVVSLLAGVYPASRAARVDPVKALRHD